MTEFARTHRWAVTNGYRVRIAAFALACLPIGLHIWPRGYGPGVWALLVLQFLIYPHLMHWRSRKAADREQSELNNMAVDAVMCGAWAAGLGFPLWISTAMFLANLLNHTITRGASGVLICLLAFAAGALASTTVIAFHVSTDTNGLVTLASMIGLAGYLSLIGIEFFAYIRQLHSVQETLDQQRKTLEGANAILHDQIGKIHDLQEKLREQANRDSLTGLFNRRYLEGTLERELARCRREGAPLTMVLLDIDHFKLVNDTYGHQAGDEVLRVFGRLLLEHARIEDIVCRYGGEEFLLVLPKMPLDIALERAAQLLQIFRETIVSHGDLRIRIRASIGIATTPEHSDSVDGLIRCADQALYQAKRRGRDLVLAYGDIAPRDSAS
ncbi:MAG: diguanylate cyclase [Sulfuritalea sp.]|jgi:diguanylate cyclase (GGDEF)-like protein|nr:diguanylate cyclase [Sulfuritalea sp.]